MNYAAYLLARLQDRSLSTTEYLATEREYQDLVARQKQMDAEYEQRMNNMDKEKQNG